MGGHMKFAHGNRMHTSDMRFHIRSAGPELMVRDPALSGTHFGRGFIFSLLNSGTGGNKKRFFKEKNRKRRKGKKVISSNLSQLTPCSPDAWHGCADINLHSNTNPVKHQWSRISTKSNQVRRTDPSVRVIHLTIESPPIAISPSSLPIIQEAEIPSTTAEPQGPIGPRVTGYVISKGVGRGFVAEGLHPWKTTGWLADIDGSST
ncbi:hypothetical protein CDAR_254331 [Caerostris darwini]|uniref:Uncharacterized protein n=1 Tax=Caerostris darwini TaxID=1538125 RepID=A0AAV4NKD4_9ARAC|nr:hypothetical protein CDAR_368901 [Caerostris darwini]GIY54999.1 hypothetical protein CDAR_254331 [Caerostris darwini]